MPQAEESNNTNRRAFLATMAAVPALVAGAVPMAADHPVSPHSDMRAGIDWLANVTLGVNIACIAENDEHVVYSVRVLPREALGPEPYPLGMTDDAFGEDLAALVAARIRQIV
jgi:hypothetical protein